MAQGFGVLTLGLAAASLAVSAGGVWVSIRMAHRVGAIDIPNERSSHEVPTPRMGGVPMVAAAGLAFACWTLFVSGDATGSMGLFGTALFALLMSVLGFWDDLSDLTPQFRFLVQFAGAVFFLRAGGSVLQELFVGGVAIPAVALIAAGSVWIVWMLNLYNFMDGIDGLAGGEAAVASGFFFFVFAWYGEHGWAAANLFITAASMGFLVHNWPPARVFMGDAGSAFLGAFYGMQSVAAALSTPVPFVVLVLPFFNFILDTTVTLFRRIWRKEKWYCAHRSHFYQRMTSIGMSHGVVTKFELAAVIFSCIAAVCYISFSIIMKSITLFSLFALMFFSGACISRKEKNLGSKLSPANTDKEME